MDIIFEIILEFFAELYLGIGELIVPEHKFKKWQESLLKMLCAIISLAILVLLIGGIVLLTGEDKRLVAGIAMTATGGGLLLVHIALFLIILIRDIKKEKEKKKNCINAALWDSQDNTE